MNRNTAVIALLLLVLVAAFLVATHKPAEAPVTAETASPSPSALPTNGIVGGTTAEKHVTAPTTPAAPESAPAAANSNDEVPSGAEVTGDNPAPDTTTPMPAAPSNQPLSLPASEGQ